MRGGAPRGGGGVSSPGASPTLTDRGNWATTTVYAIGDVVTQSGQRYVANTAHTAAALFSTDAAKWTQLSIDGTAVTLADLGTWATSTAYAVGDLVTYAGARYVAKTAHTAGTFTTDLAAAKWSLTGYLTPVVTTPLEGMQTLIYGCSYAAGTGASNNYGYAQRLNRRFDWQQVFNRAVSATTCHYEAMVEPVNDYNNFIKAQGFMAIMDSVINDAADAENVSYGGASGTAPAQAVAKMKNMKMFLIACIRRSGAPILDTAGTYTGTWTANTGDAESIPFTSGAAGTSHSTTTLNDSVTFTGLTAGGKYAVMLQGIDNTKFGTNGAAFTISTGAGTLVTGTTSNQFYQGRDTMSRSAMPVIITMPAGQTSLTITKTDASGSKLYVNAIVPQLAAGASNWTLILKAFYVNTVSNAVVDQMNAAVDAAITAHGNGGEIIVIDPNSLGWDKTTMLRPDGLHPNDKGHALIADAFFNAALTATYGPQRNLYTT